MIFLPNIVDVLDSKAKDPGFTSRFLRPWVNGSQNQYAFDDSNLVLLLVFSLTSVSIFKCPDLEKFSFKRVFEIGVFSSLKRIIIAKARSS